MRSCLFALFLLTSTRLISQSDYFQQEVHYEIDVTLNDKEHLLTGYEKFEYVNNSPDTLHEIMIHLWPNAYKNSRTAMAKQKFRDGDYFMLWAPQKDRGYIDSLDFKLNNQKVEWQFYQDYEDIAILFIDEGLLPGKSVTISTPFKVKLPSGSISRLGHVGESYQITQWYAKPAVYDQQGWHEMPYLTQGEFYSEYGSYDVKITLPENYVVGATGDLQTASEIDWMNELSQKPLPERITKTANAPSANDEFPKSSTKMKTLHFIQKDVHDFGWFADKRWIVRKGEIELPHSKRKVTTWALFTPIYAENWDDNAIKAINDGVYYYSLWTGDYPYNQCTAVDGTISAGGGMEYPNVTVIGNTSSSQQLATVIIHEVGHNWFYGILGSNERDNAWMDEGINSFFETRTLLATNDSLNTLGAVDIGGLDASKILGLSDFSYQYLSEELVYLLSARGNKDQPIQMPSDYFSSLNYGTIVYKKTAIAFNFLMQYLGEDVFNQCMAAYFEKWKFKHPQPQDIEKVFEDVSKKNLDWFFDTLINTKGKIDVKATSIRKKSDHYELTVYNKGDIASPFAIDVIRDGKTVQRTWQDGYDKVDYAGPQMPGEWKTYKIEAQRGDVIKLNNMDGIPEYDKNNNTIRTKGIFRRAEPYKLSFLTSIDDPNHSQVFWVPMVGWNNYNKWMVGVNLHNQVAPARNFNWNVSPMYSIATNSVVGFGKLETYNGRMGFGIRAQRFAYETIGSDDSLSVYTYRLISPYLRIKLFPNRYKKDWSGELRAEWIMIGGRLKNESTSLYGEYTSFESKPNVSYGKDGDIHHIRVTASVKKKMLRSELRIQSTVEAGEYTDYGLMHQHTVNYDYIYRGKGKKKIRNRLYFGQSNGFTMYAAGQRTGIGHSVTSTASIVGQDYVYDALFLGRSESDGLLSQQIHRTQGGLAAPTTLGANMILTSLNTEFDLPVKFPIGIYGGIALMQNKDLVKRNTVNWTNAWNAGVSLPLIRNVFQIYVPLVYSQNIENGIQLKNLDFTNTILFELNLKLCNPLDLMRNFDL